MFQQNLVPHLAETWRINRLTCLSKVNQPLGVANSRAAAADAKGVLHLIEPGFTRLILDEWTEWRGPCLPDKLAAQVECQDRRFVGNTLVIHLSGMNDQILRMGGRNPGWMR